MSETNNQAPARPIRGELVVKETREPIRATVDLTPTYTRINTAILTGAALEFQWGHDYENFSEATAVVTRMGLTLYDTDGADEYDSTEVAIEAEDGTLHDLPPETPRPMICGDVAAVRLLLEAATKAREEIRAHWNRDELAERHCGMEVALDRLEEALELFSRAQGL